MATAERHERDMFNIVKVAVKDGVGARLGTLSLPKRRPIDTPNFIGLTARGAVPHLTPDNISKLSELGGVYVALEDCKSVPTHLPPSQQTLCCMALGWNELS